MLAADFLSLHLIRLRSADEWTNKSGGLGFIFTKGGEARYLAGGLDYRLVPGDVLVLNSTIAGRFLLLRGGEFVFWYFPASLEHLFALFASNEIGLLQDVVEDLKAAKLYPAASAVAVECHRLLRDVPPQFSLDHRSQLLRVAATILTVEFKNAHSRRSGFIRMEEHMVQIFEKLSSEELLNLSVGQLADKFSCSRRHLNRLFHQHFGYSIAGLRMEMRLMKAVSLLRDPDTKVISVAESCGFNHLGLFNTCFKRRFGTSPGKWRQLNGEVASSPSAPSSKFTDQLPINGLSPLNGMAAVASQPGAATTSARKANSPNRFKSPVRADQRAPSDPIGPSSATRAKPSRRPTL